MKANLSSTEWATIFLLGVLFYFVLATGVWAVWITVLPYFWPDGPAEVIDPSLGMFMGAMFLLAFVRRVLTK